MKEKLEKIVEEGQALAEKHSWLAKGYADLITAINVELAKIPDMNENDLYFPIREWKENDNNFSRKIYAHLQWANDAVLTLQFRKENQYDWACNTHFDPSTQTIREFAKKLPEMFDFFLSEIEKKNNDNRVTIDIITEMLAKVR